MLYGSTPSSLFEYNIAQNTVVPIGPTPADFDPVNATPLPLGNAVYETSQTGGTNAKGAIYQFANGVTTPLYNFTGGDNGAGPEGGVIAFQNTLYGTTNTSSAKTAGTLYSYNLTTGDYNVLHAFVGEGNPVAAPVESDITPGSGDPTLYGTTGATLYSYDLKTSQFTDLHDFAPATDGTDPEESSLYFGSSVIYGTTSTGGAYGGGTAFSFDLTDDYFDVLYSFGATPNDGTHPTGGILFGDDGSLYGTTATGGTHGDGTIFAIAGDYPIPEPTSLALLTLAVPMMRRRQR